ncbi:hypothetical protein MUGA111182_08775 [Mucilaginibacter galii]|uniref:Uncharacterized protein n=1 Tax=Mucilaginibacter galii TaxID=2005073 RepID=A0A917J8N1_9SPHI|nr:hypothetical protein [Mucilaginibacter galii]GGI49481.1 hypothetical protein GCM10011425_06930 [Mucilaginibacter galii]
MIFGEYVKCKECAHLYRIRFNMGNSFPQKGTFKCQDCGANLEYGFAKDRSKIMVGIETTDDKKDATIQNIHPEITVDPAQASNPFYFPSLDYMTQFNIGGHERLAEFRKGQKSTAEFKKLLDELMLPLRYLKEKRWAMLENDFGKNQAKVRREILKKALAVGRKFIEGKWDLLYRDALSEAEKIKRKPAFPQFKAYLLGRSDEFLIERMYAVLDAYNDAYHELLPTLLTQKFDMQPIGESTSANWKKLEMVYGGLYETFGDLLVVPTGMNNLLAREDHEIFQSSPAFTFSKYLDSDKAGRCDNFAGNAKLAGLSRFYDSGIRNATYHKASKVESDDQEITLKTGKGGRTERTLTLVEYISHCNELFAHCMILLNLTYKLTQ